MNSISKTDYKSESGFTLIELIISITLLAIIVLAVLSGLRFAARAMSSSGTYVGETYQIHTYMEQDLSMADYVPNNATASTILLDSHSSDTNYTTADEVLQFTWVASSSSPGASLSAFSVDGVVVTRDATDDGGYLDTPIDIFIPVSVD